MIFADYETRSLANLKIVGGRNYCLHPSTEVLCGVALIDGVAYCWGHLATFGLDVTEDLIHVKSIQVSSEMPDAVRHAAKTQPIAAHNAEGFDRWLWERLGNPEATWVDTMRLAGKVGLPAGLDAIGKTLYGKGKHDGHRIMMKLAVPMKNGRFFPVNSQNLQVVAQYCLKDVDLMAQIWYDELEAVANDELELMQVDAVINRRGFLFDAELAEKIISFDAMNRQETLDNLPVTGEVLRSTVQLAAWLAEYDVQLPNFQRGTITEYLQDNTLPVIVQEVLLGRIGATKITSAKVSRAIGLQGKDGRIRNGLMYHAAHTGRWGGRGFQPHNLPRGIPMDIDASVKRLTETDWCPNDAELSTLIRACIVAPDGKVFIVIDYSQIEARVLPWMAGDNDLLDRIRGGEEIYIAMAKIMNTTRKVGKVAVLGCGYQAGGKTLGAFAEGYGVDFEELGLTAQGVVEMYRDANPLVAGTWTGSMYEGIKCRKGGLWRTLDAGLKELAWGREREFYGGRCHWRKDRMNLHCTLPSGRVIVYRNFTMEDRVPVWGGDPKPTMVYENRNGIMISQYGGKFTENCVQATARDIMADALVKLDDVVLHIHDEVIIEVSDLDPETKLSQICDIMRDAPSWANGLPVDVDGFVTKRYCKL